MNSSGPSPQDPKVTTFRCPQSSLTRLGDLATNSKSADENGSEVWIHVYDLDPYTGWANGTLMRGLELGLYHCAVEVYGSEWSFLYFEHAWDDYTLTGVRGNTPKQLRGYIYRESLRMGVSPLEKVAVHAIIHSLMNDWRSAGYHLTHRNCVHFAEVFVRKLGLQVEIPTWIRNLQEGTVRSQVVDYMVDSFWGISKQYMTWKHKKQTQRELSSEGTWWNLGHCGKCATVKKEPEHEQVVVRKGRTRDAPGTASSDALGTVLPERSSMELLPVTVV